jgi:hypothetical protein
VSATSHARLDAAVKAGGLPDSGRTCQECRCRPALLGLTRCETCRARYLTRRAERMAAGLCPECGDEFAVPGKSYCEECALVQNCRVRERLRRRRAEGLCERCGKEPICKDRSRALGEGCLEKVRLRDLRRRGRQRELRFGPV